MEKIQSEQLYESLKSSLEKLRLTLKVPITKRAKIHKLEDDIHKISQKLLLAKPNSFLLKAVEIKSYYEKPNEELDKCFPSNFYLNDDNKFKYQLFEYAFNNLKNYENNEITSKDIKKIIINLPANSFHKKYIQLIEDITKKMNEENAILCNLLVTTPYKYKDLFFLVNTCINLTILPENPVDFYSIKNIEENKKKFFNYLKGKNRDFELIEMKKEFQKQINTLAGNIKSLELSRAKDKDDYEEKIKSLQKRTDYLEMELLKIQVRDVIKVFMNKIAFIFKIQNYNKTILPSLTERLNEFTKDADEDKKQGGKLILDIVNKIENLKLGGNDLGHEFKNIGFNLESLPPQIKEKYIKLYKKENLTIYGFDCVALILCFEEINNSDLETSKNKYEFFQEIFKISIKDWENSKVNLQNLILDYKI